MNMTEIPIAREHQLFNGHNFHVFIFTKTESVSGLHQHDYYEFTIVLTGRYYQEIDGQRVLLERGDFVFIPVGSQHQSFYIAGATRILNVGISKRFFEKHFQSLFPSEFTATQAYAIDTHFLAHIESVITSHHFRENEFDEFIEVVCFYITNRLRHYRDEPIRDTVPLWLRNTVEAMHDKLKFGDAALENMVQLSGKSQEYLTRATQRFYSKTPMQIINNIRINFAKKQLEITNASVTDIAYESGYSSPSLFIKTFKKFTSFTPNNYRKKINSCNEE
ncbi:transcriptional regulator ChbR [Rosenbergiella epipactidis]|uniref:transcriptional regulator ChbR n=1 Tax=Rosenbergiella epipactidis TaxID=1544694 RepID=UPI001F4DBCED|nr:transcriptional regulator ChbR [Rosenbergiella epipactidis]